MPSLFQRAGMMPYVCPSCGQKVVARLGRCPECGAVATASAPATATGTPTPSTTRAAQLIRTYTGKHLEQQFQRDAQKLAAQGWKAGTPAYGGEAKIGLARTLVFGLRSSRKPNTLTVVYTRE